jgi:hypothetical protein
MQSILEEPEWAPELVWIQKSSKFLPLPEDEPQLSNLFSIKKHWVQDCTIMYYRW